MQLTDVDTDAEFRAQVRDWLHDHVPREPRPMVDRRAGREFDLAWQRTQYDGGYAGVSWPSEYGGVGLGLGQQLIWYEEYVRAGAPDIGCGFVGVNHAGPTLIARADDEHKAFHLPRILRGEAVWCQGFSEPGAGSDLASLRTRGELDGDEIVVTGQKIWTSEADLADYQELLVRTDPDSERHRGLTWVICDMSLPGVEVRPIRTMAGTTEFSEVFYDEVRIPLRNVVGGLGNGWSVAMSTLGFERGTGFLREQLELARYVEDRLAEADRRDPVVVAALAVARAEVRAMYAMTLRMVSRSARGLDPGASASMIRLYYSQLRQQVERLVVDGADVDGVVLGRDALVLDRYLDGYKVTIGAGTKDVQRNIIGERGLGLPRP
ncbi:acyl-CoA dehydrogenase family protein [uncultured Jatrophihabitans sp.]|uniref:acyl-CoA dehydrogenase family protein n=1 Tax=uncultured Jatrophihabitans sp. TaxID=1610747 RepID=UPI0035CA6017